MPSILILEDDITFSLMLKTWLGRKGFEVSSVSSVSDARSRIEDASFDLILSDLRLPDGDGIDLLKWIKENNFVIPLIMMTSYAEIQTAVQAIKLGASDYIAKPLNPEELLGKIKDVIKTETGPVASATEPERPARSAKRPELPSCSPALRACTSGCSDRYVCIDYRFERYGERVCCPPYS